MSIYNIYHIYTPISINTRLNYITSTLKKYEYYDFKFKYNFIFVIYIEIRMRIACHEIVTLPVAMSFAIGRYVYW